MKAFLGIAVGLVVLAIGAGGLYLVQSRPAEVPAWETERAREPSPDPITEAVSPPVAAAPAPTPTAPGEDLPLQTFADGRFQVRFPGPMTFTGDDTFEAYAPRGESIYTLLYTDLERPDPLPLDLVRTLSGRSQEERQLESETDVDVGTHRAIRRRYLVPSASGRMRQRVEYALAIHTFLFVLLVSRSASYADEEAEAFVTSLAAVAGTEPRPATVAGSCLQPNELRCTEASSALEEYTVVDQTEGACGGTWLSSPCPDTFDHPLIHTWHPTRDRACVLENGRAIVHEYVIPGHDEIAADFTSGCHGQLVPRDPRATVTP